jgi:hypothetical protein
MASPSGLAWDARRTRSLLVSCWIIFFIIGSYGFQYPVDVGAIVKRRIVKKLQVRHVPKAQFSGQFPFDKPFGTLKSR